MTTFQAGQSADDMHRVQFIHEPVHERLVNWARWCTGGRGGACSSPMFRLYKAPRYRSSTDEAIHIPMDGLDAALVEKIVAQLPEKHRDALRYFYVYSHIGMGIWQALRGLGVNRETLIRLVHDGRSMVKNNVERQHAGMQRKETSHAKTSVFLANGNAEKGTSSVSNPKNERPQARGRIAVRTRELAESMD